MPQGVVPRVRLILLTGKNAVMPCYDMQDATFSFVRLAYSLLA